MENTFTFTPKVDSAQEFREIAFDFSNPLDLVREAISNAFDAQAKKIGLDFSVINEYGEKILKITELGKSLDINAGQAIDRAGVMMGMSFPCGPELEAKAKEYSGPRRRVNTCVKGLNCNLSGLENMASKIYAESSDVRETASFVFDFISETLFRMSENLREEYPAIPIVYAGGVMSSSFIRERLSVFGGYHAEARFSSDNASGCALLCREKYGRSIERRD